MSSRDPFRYEHVHCPRCGTSELATDRLRTCARCRGAWLSTHDLAERIAVMQPAAPPQIPWSTAQRGTLPCVTCAAPMQPLILYDVPIDWCRAHGVWFDAGELEQTLKRAYLPPPGAEPASAGITLGDVVAAGGEVTADGLFELALHALAALFTVIDL